mgnify:CR=1 FL=1
MKPTEEELKVFHSIQWNKKMISNYYGSDDTAIIEKAKTDLINWAIKELQKKNKVLENELFKRRVPFDEIERIYQQEENSKSQERIDGLIDETVNDTVRVVAEFVRQGADRKKILNQFKERIEDEIKKNNKQ